MHNNIVLFNFASLDESRTKLKSVSPFNSGKQHYRLNGT